MKMDKPANSSPNNRTDKWANPAVASMRYEIREIVNVAKQLEVQGLNINWENIGDPIQRGHEIPNWVRDLIKDSLKENQTFSYVPSQGYLPTREFLAEYTNKRGGAQITSEDLLFFNGLGDAISTLYQCLDSEARVLIPSPVYSTHGSFEKLHTANKPVLTYELNPLDCLLYTSPSPRDRQKSRMPSSA